MASLRFYGTSTERHIESDAGGPDYRVRFGSALAFKIRRDLLIPSHAPQRQRKKVFGIPRSRLEVSKTASVG